MLGEAKPSTREKVYCFVFIASTEQQSSSRSNRQQQQQQLLLQQRVPLLTRNTTRARGVRAYILGYAGKDCLCCLLPLLPLQPLQPCQTCRRPQPAAR